MGVWMGSAVNAVAILLPSYFRVTKEMKEEGMEAWWTYWKWFMIIAGSIAAIRCFIIWRSGKRQEKEILERIAKEKAREARRRKIADDIFRYNLRHSTSYAFDDYDVWKNIVCKENEGDSVDNS